MENYVRDVMKRAYSFTLGRAVNFFKLLHSLFFILSYLLYWPHTEKTQLDKAFAYYRPTFCL